MEGEWCNMTNSMKGLIARRLVQIVFFVLAVYSLGCSIIAIPAIIRNIDFITSAIKEILLFGSIVWGVLSLVFFFINHCLGIPVHNLKQTIKVFSRTFDITFILACMLLIRPQFPQVFKILYFLIWILIALIAASKYCDSFPPDGYTQSK